jgi:hypothetical protein
MQHLGRWKIIDRLERNISVKPGTLVIHHPGEVQDKSGNATPG